MAVFLDFLQHSGLDPVKSSIKRPLQAGKDLVHGKPGAAFQDLRHIVSDNEKAQSKGMGDYGLRGWVGKHPLESAGAVVAAIYGGAAVAGAGAAGSGGAAAGGSAAGGGALGGSTAAPITAAVGTPTGAAAGGSAGTGAASSGGLMSTLSSNPAYMQMGMSMLQGSGGGTAQPNPNGGTASLGGTGYQAYMYPGASTQTAPPAPKQNDATKSPAMIAAGQAPSPTTGASAAGAVPGAMANTFTPPKNETQAPAPISEAKGTKVDNRSFLQKMNDSSSDQWANFTGTGKYDTSNGQKAPANAMSWQDKMNAGFGLAASVMNAFDRR